MVSEKFGWTTNVGSSQQDWCVASLFSILLMLSRCWFYGGVGAWPKEQLIRFWWFHNTDQGIFKKKFICYCDCYRQPRIKTWKSSAEVWTLWVLVTCCWYHWWIRPIYSLAGVWYIDSTTHITSLILCLSVSVFLSFCLSLSFWLKTYCWQVSDALLAKSRAEFYVDSQQQPTDLCCLLLVEKIPAPRIQKRPGVTRNKSGKYRQIKRKKRENSLSFSVVVVVELVAVIVVTFAAT